MDELPELVVFVPMCCEFFHHGHVNILSEASNHGKVTVLLMTDDAMKSYKREPYYEYCFREKVIKSVRYVENVYACKSFAHMVELISKNRPDVFVHGTDWKEGVQRKLRAQVIEALTKYGGILIEPEYTTGISSTMCYNKATQ